MTINPSKELLTEVKRLAEFNDFLLSILSERQVKEVKEWIDKGKHIK